MTFDYPANRGAANAEAFALQEARIAAAMSRLDADVTGLMQIENDGYGQRSPLQSLVNAVNAAQPESEAFTFVPSSAGGLLGSGAIAVGLLYKAGRVKPASSPTEIPMPIQTRADGSLVRMRTALVQVFEHIETGERFAVAVNSLKSKSSTCIEDDNSPMLIDSAQGSCNALRVSAAVALGEGLRNATLPERVIVLADLNAYSAEDPLAVLTG